MGVALSADGAPGRPTGRCMEVAGRRRSARMTRRSSGFHHSRARLLEVLTAAGRIWAPVHAGHSRPSAPRRHAGPGATAATAASGEPYRSPQRQEPHRRLDRWQRAIWTDVDIAVVNCIDTFPNPLSAMPDTLYIPGAPKREPLGRGGEGCQSEIRWPWPSEQTVSFGGPAVPSASAAVPWHSLSSPESRRQRDRTPQCCVASGSSRAPPAYALGCSRRFPCACGDRPRRGNLDGPPRPRPRRSTQPTAWNPTTLAASSRARALCGTSTRSSIEMPPTK